MFQFIYRLPLLFSALTAFAVWFLWAFFDYKYRNSQSNKKAIWVGLNFIAATVMTFLIIYTTVISRSGNHFKVVLTPFYSFTVAKVQPEMWRQLFMNVIMFLPLGMSLACLISERTRILTTIVTVTLSGALLSLVIELLQYFYHLGEAWTDDVICNLLGAFLGSLVVVVPKIFKKQIQ